MAAPDTAKLKGILGDLLVSATSCLTDPPARRFISAGEPSAPPLNEGTPCGQLAVWFVSLRTEIISQTGNPPTAKTPIRVATLAATLHVPVCMATSPTAAQHNTDGESFTDAAYQLFAGLLYMHMENTLLPNYAQPYTLTRGANVTEAVAVDREGGLARVQVTLDVTL